MGQDSLMTPSGRGYAITEDEDIDPTKGISLDNEGVVHMTLMSGTEISPFLVAGVTHPFRVTKIHADSTASGFWGYY